MANQLIGWDLPQIEARIDELYRCKNELIMQLKNDVNVIGKKILHVESLIRLNESVRDFILERKQRDFH